VRSPRAAWEATQQFLRDHTIAELRPKLRLTVWGATKFNDQAVIDSTLEEATATFGPLTAVSGIFHNWDLPGERLEDALEFAFADERRPKQEVGPVSLSLSYSFTWKNLLNPSPDVARKLTPKGGNSLGLSLGGRKLFIQPTFLFEMPEQASSFLTGLQLLEAATPFKPRDDYYYVTEPRKSTDGLKLTRLKEGWKDLGTRAQRLDGQMSDCQT
jgi:hypothetical protein